MHDRRRARWGPLAALLLALLLTPLLTPSFAQAGASLPPGFQEESVFSGLVYPTAVRFAPGSDPKARVFVSEKRGRIWAYEGLDDTTPTQVVNLQREVYNFSDRGLLGLAVDPQFPARPYLYASYTRDALPSGGAVPHYATGPDYDDETCAINHCTVTGRLVKITVDPDTNVAVGTPQTLIDDWCSEFLSHTIGDLAFDPDGQLWASGGDGADFDDGDYGQSTSNPCGDPIQSLTGTPYIEAEGGALRSQDLQTPGDPTGLAGTVIRIDPDTGAASSDNPNLGTADLNARRVVAYGLRNPFRFALRPGTRELWTGDVGWGSYEEINRVPDPTLPGAGVKNFGWPCYEGDGLPGSKIQPVYQSYGIGLCARLYQQGQSAVTAPAYSYFHDLPYTDHSPCAQVRGGNVQSFALQSSVSSVAFYAGGDYGSQYDGGLFFGDYARQCIWFMAAGEDGPDPTQVSVFAEGAGFPVDIQRGPGGDLFYVDIVSGAVNRVQKSDLTVSLTPDTFYGPAPLTVNFTATPSGANGHPVTYVWDFNGDGFFGDSGETSATPTRQFPDVKPGVKVRVRATDTVTGDEATSPPVLIAAGDEHPPSARIDSPSAALTWTVGQLIGFSGGGDDADEPGGIPANNLTWDVILQHCPGGCHQHFVRTAQGVASGAFDGVEHEYPSRITLKLKVSDEYGLTDTKTVELEPQTASVGVLTDPAGLTATVNLTSGPTPFNTTVIKGSTVTVATTESQIFSGRPFTFESWSDGGGRVHPVTVNGDMTLTARFRDPAAVPATPPAATPPAAVTPPKPKFRRGPAVKVGRSGIATLALRCPTKKACSAALVLRPAAGKPTVIGRRTVKIGARRTARLRLKLPASVRRTLKKKRRLAVQSTVVFRTAGRKPVTDRVRFDLLAPRR